MKIITRLLVFFLVINVFNSCTEEEVNYALQDISAPSELKAIFDITQDDSGEVSVTPTALGASVFRLYFGDVENESATEVAPGETATHVYGEGEFTLRIVAVGISGLTSELSRIVTISFSAPSGLEVAITQSNPLEVTVTPTAENATVYDIYFGDVENEEPTTIMNGESAVHLYDAPGDYTIRVVARGAGAATAEISEVFTVVDLTNAEVFPIDFESNQTLTGVFEESQGVTGSPIANPDATGINTSETVFEFNKADGAAWYSGIFHIFSEDMDLTASQEFSFTIWSPKAGINVRMQLEKEGGGGGPTVFVDQTLATANEWVTVTYDFSGVVNTADAYDKFVIFPEFDDAGQPAGDGSVYYLDNIGLGASAPEVATSLPVDFESNQTLSGVFEESQGVTGGPIANPDANGINTSATVYEFNKAADAAWYSGIYQIFPTDLDLTTTQQFTFKFWSPKAGINVRFQLEKEGGGGGPTVSLDQTVATANEWVSLTYNFSGVVNTADAYDKIVIFPDFDDVGQPAGDGSIYYVDDLAQGGGDMPTTAAPNPTQAQTDVINMYSNVYSQDVTVSSWRSDWSTSTLTDIQVAGNDTKEYIDADFVGVEFYDTPVDASAMDFFHVDVWTPNATTFRVKLVDLGSGSTEAEIAFDGIAQGQWVSLDIPMADFISGGMTATNSIQQLIFSGLPTAEFDFYIDNVYFYQSSGGGTCNNAGISGSGTTSFAVDFETGGTGGTSQWQVFENSDNPVLEVIANPASDGVNGSATVAKFTARFGAQAPCTDVPQPFAGVETPLTTPLTLDASNSTVKIMVWKSVISDVGIKFSVGSAAQPEIKVANTLTDQWEELTFDFSSYIGLAEAINIDKLIVFPDFNARAQENIVYFDNITLSASGGGGGSAPTSAAPDPSQAQANVINMYSNAYTSDVNVSSWRSDWSTSTLTDIQVAGNDTKEYIDADFVGVEFYAPNQVDASTMDFFHVDVWTPNASTFRVKLVDLGSGTTEAEIAFDGIAQGEWVSLDIPMADFISGGMTATNSIQQLIFSGLPTGTFDFYIDNVYFYKIPPTSPNTAAPDPTEAQADVINMYSNVYTQDVNVSSWRSDWSTSTLSDIQVAGNDTKEYIDADFVGVEFYAPDAVDASGMAFFHVDVWTPNATTFRVKLVDLGSGTAEAEIAFDGIAQGEWVSLDIPMADFISGGMTATNSIEQLIFSGLPTGTFDFYIDNVYFHN